MSLSRLGLLTYFLMYSIGYAAPIINQSFDNYSITGHSAKSLREQMSMLGPTDMGQDHFDASTHWHVQWQYNYESTSHVCRFTKVDVKVDITYRFPEWVDYAVSDYELKSRWNTYMQHLLTHEKGHAEHGIQAAMAIEDGLRQLPAMHSCDELTTTADNIAYQIIAQHNTKDINYENATDHGVTQGATFP